ncbi:MAG: hypothetical protein U1E15_04965, partial [Hyphomicrobiales bacterium]
MNAFRTLALGLSVFSFAFSTPATSGDGGKAPCTAQASADVKIVPTADLPCDVTMGPALLLSFGVLGGGGDSVTFGGLTADAFLPLGNQFALQLDGDVALGKNDFSFAHTAAHALYRDGGALSLGLYGDW